MHHNRVAKTKANKLAKKLTNLIKMQTENNIGSISYGLIVKKTVKYLVSVETKQNVSYHQSQVDTLTIIIQN